MGQVTVVGDWVAPNRNVQFQTGLFPGEHLPLSLLLGCCWGEAKCWALHYLCGKVDCACWHLYSMLYGEHKMWMLLHGLKWTLCTAKCISDSGWRALLWPHLRALCSCSSVFLQGESAGPVSEPQSIHTGAPASTQFPNWGGSFVQGQQEVWAAFHPGLHGVGRRQLLPAALSINLGTAVLRTLLVSLDLRPPTAKLRLPSPRQVHSNQV